MTQTRNIDKRFLPPVAGIDLEQSLNYVRLADVGEKFAYQNYTGSRLPYVKGSRPRLEAIAAKVIGNATRPMDKAQLLATFVADEMIWSGIYTHRKGKPSPPDRGLDEEKLIRSGYGWCNEQARVLCALTQVSGMTSRLVFGAHLRKGYGHVVTEVLLPTGWMMIDQSFGYLFQIKGKPVRASEVWQKASCRKHFEPVYLEMCKKLIAEIGFDVVNRDFKMAAAKNPLDGYSDIGYHNHFVH